jgi:hypothetical protein
MRIRLEVYTDVTVTPSRLNETRLGLNKIRVNNFPTRYPFIIIILQNVWHVKPKLIIGQG